MKKPLTLVACIAWAAVAVSSATPADAIAITTYYGGGYANCSANASSSVGSKCGYQYSYSQTIKFLTTSCGSGACNQETGAVYTDFVYAAGRKVASLVQNCSGMMTYDVYGLGSCAC